MSQTKHFLDCCCRSCVNELLKDIEKLETKNAKLSLILFHRENGLSHPDLQGEIEKSKMAEDNANLKADLDAKCRVSQMLLAGQKKFKKRIKKLKKENIELKQFKEAYLMSLEDELETQLPDGTGK